MAERAWVQQAHDYYNTRLQRCAGLLNGDVSADITLPRHRDVTIHITGTFGGATVTVKGSNDFGAPITYDTLDDAFGDLLSITLADIKLRQLLPAPYRIRVEVSGGDGSTSITAAVRMGTIT